MAIDSIYALQALPPPNKFKPAKGVKQVSDSAQIAAEHEQQQTTIASSDSERRKKQDRRKRKQAVAVERRKANRRQQQADDATDNTASDAENDTDVETYSPTTLVDSATSDNDQPSDDEHHIDVTV